MEVVGIFYGHLVYFTAIWNFCGDLVYFIAIWYILFCFGIGSVLRRILQL
jgi:hypothetical protein